MEHWIIGGLLAALVGAAVSYLSYLLSSAAMKKNSGLFAAVSVPRQIIQIGYLAVVYFVQPLTPWGLAELLVGAAMGLTIAMFFFTKNLLKQMYTSQEEASENGGEAHG